MAAAALRPIVRARDDTALNVAGAALRPIIRARDETALDVAGAVLRPSVALWSASGAPQYKPDASPHSTLDELCPSYRNYGTQDMFKS